MKDKAKHQHSLPNRQLARAFNFSAEDLATNRAGFMTWAQANEIALWQRELFGGIVRFIPYRPKRRKSVAHICGKIKLQSDIKMSYPTQKLTVQNSYKLSIPEQGISFLLNQKQFQMLSDNVAYHIYYESDTNRILSLERTLNDCHEAQN